METTCKQILIIDDDTDRIELLQAIIHELNHKSILISELSNIKSSAESCSPHLIILNSPEPGKDVTDYIANIKQEFIRLAPFFIIISEKDNPEATITYLKAGVNDVITAPLNPEMLKLKINNLMNLKSDENKISQLNQQLEQEKESIKKERNILAKYFSKDLIEAILSGDISTEIGGDIKTASILFCDLRRSTAIAESTEPDLFAKFLNNLFTDITDLIYGEMGSVNKFLGDGILATFGCPKPIEDDAFHCAQVAIKIRKYLNNYNEFRPQYLEEPIEMGVGIARGKLFTGNIGSVNQMEYTVLGDPVNVASKLQHLTKTAKVDILMDSGIKNCIAEKAKYKNVRSSSIKGRLDHEAIYYLEDMKI